MEKSSKKYYLLKVERDRWLSVIEVLPWSTEASEYFGEIKADLERAGLLIDDFDIAIGAFAIAHGCAVITTNLSHIQRIKNLNCQKLN